MTVMKSYANTLEPSCYELMIDTALKSPDGVLNPAAEQVAMLYSQCVSLRRIADALENKEAVKYRKVLQAIASGDLTGFRTTADVAPNITDANELLARIKEIAAVALLPEGATFT